MKKQAQFDRRAVIDPRQSLPDFSADWRLPGPEASNAEVEARFYYEFARESRTILRLTESLCHFSRQEILRAQRQTLSYPGSPLEDLHPYCFKIVYALMPTINLREVSWNQLKPEQRQSLINEFSHRRPAFRRLNNVELFDFAQGLFHWKEPESGVSPRWYGGSRLFWDGMEEITIRIDWNQGSQAVKAAMEQWFQRHKRGLVRLKREGKLPDSPHGSYMFKLRDETGAKNPRRKYLTALRGLGAMRLLSNHTLLEAIQIAEGSLFSRDIRSRSAFSSSCGSK